MGPSPGGCTSPRTGTLRRPTTRPQNLPEILQDTEFRHLPVTADHAIAAGRLPFIHRDPFDRMLIAQAGCEDLTLVTRDPLIQR